jgi:hypothetical protein
MEAIFTQRLLRAGLFGLGLALSGCASTNFDICASCCCWRNDLPAHGEVTQVMALWAEGVVDQPSADPRNPVTLGRPVPGFSGRVYLYGPASKEPLAAEGVITVQLYDASNPTPADNQPPLEVWNLSEENLQRIGKKDGLGWGYNIWVPWSTMKPDIHRVYLVVKYQPKQGLPAFSGSTKLAVNDGAGLRPPAMLETRIESKPSYRIIEGTGEPTVRSSTIAVPRGSSLSRVGHEGPEKP